ncbi:MAG: RNA polymerase sigma factor [Myxococcales bacterium]|nr:RNA polymerase sigma factor [Myxococcales bacterium]
MTDVTPQPRIDRVGLKSAPGVGPTPCNPDELVRLVKAGDMQALDRITRCHGQRLLAVGRRYCRSNAEAEDAVQDALVSAGTHLTSFRGDGSVEGWLVRMVANACHHMRRGRKNDFRLHDTEQILMSDEGSPEEKAMVGQLSETLGQALLDLPPRDRTIVLLAETEGWTGPEIAEKLGMSAGNVRVRLHRSRLKLRENLEQLHGVG